MNTDAIAARDLGFGFRQSAPPGLAPSRSETANSIANTSGNSLNADRKRGPSPDRDRRREDDRKRARGSPSRDRERDRDRRDTSIRRPRYGSPPTGWDRDRDGPGAMRKDIPREREEPPQKQVIIPAVLAQFIGMLPPKEQFDGKPQLYRDLLHVRSLAIKQVRCSGLTRSCLSSATRSYLPHHRFGPSHQSHHVEVHLIISHAQASMLTRTWCFQVVPLQITDRILELVVDEVGVGETLARHVYSA
jgi:hypothetical protein